MALIYCNQCGKQVSDRAQCCPHCGAPVAYHSENADNQYSTKSDTGPRAIRIDDKAPSNKNKWIIAAVAAMITIMLAAGIWWAHNRSSHSDIAQEAIDTVVQEVDSVILEPDVMLAPDIPVNAYGYYTLDMCPNNHPGLEVTLDIIDETLYSCKIMKEGVYLQTVKFDTEYSTISPVSTSSIKFLDANFDGYVDILLGPGHDRSLNAILLWNSEDCLFKRATAGSDTVSVSDDVFNGDFEFYPGDQVVYKYNSGGWASSTKQFLKWHGSKLLVDEELLTFYLKSDYSYENVRHRYTVRKGQTGKVIASTDNPKQLPERWRSKAYVPSREEEAKYAQADREFWEFESRLSRNADEDEYSTQRYDNAANSVVPAWLEGNWKYTTSMMGRRMECRVGINGNIIVVMYNGEMQYTGPFTIEGNQLIYNRKNGTCDYMLIDRANQRIMADETTPLHRF